MLGNLNIFLFNLINHNLQNNLFDTIIPIISKIASTKILLIIVIAIILIGIVMKNKKIRNIGILCLIGFVLTMIFGFLLKNGIQEPRPFMTLANVHLLENTQDSLYSFPSGHCARIFVLITIFILNMKYSIKEHSKLISAILVIFGVLIMISRVYVGAHYPIDVFGGAILGIVCGLIVSYFREPIFNITDFLFYKLNKILKLDKRNNSNNPYNRKRLDKIKRL